MPILPDRLLIAHLGWSVLVGSKREARNQDNRAIMVVKVVYVDVVSRNPENKEKLLPASSSNSIKESSGHNSWGESVARGQNAN